MANLISFPKIVPQPVQDANSELLHIPVPNPLSVAEQAASSVIKIPTLPSVLSLAERFNLKNVSIANQQPTKNPYESALTGKNDPLDAPVVVPSGYTRLGNNIGTPVYSNILFGDTKGNNTYYDNNGNKKSYNPLALEAVIIGVSQQKNIVKTQIQGRDGTVKEYIGMDDYAVTFNGVICGTNGHYPTDEVVLLKKMLDANVSIPVSCSYLQNLDIHNIVIESYNIEQSEGLYSQQPFSINAKSDVPINLLISQS